MDTYLADQSILKEVNKSTAMNRADYRPYEFDLPETRLHFHLDPETTTVDASLDFVPKSEFPNAPLVLDGEDLKLISLKINGKDLDQQDFMVTKDHLIIKNTPSEPFTLETSVEISPPKDNASGAGLYMDETPSFMTQCEAQNFRKITFYPDRPDVMSVFKSVTLEANKKEYPLLLSNGHPSKPVDLNNGKHQLTWSDPHKKPAYLFALVGSGGLEHIQSNFETMSGNNVDLKIHASKKDLGEVDFAMQSLKRAMSWDEKKYGREYDLDLFQIVATPFFNMGAMENKGLNVFNTKYTLGSKDTATDDELEKLEAVIGHEYFHNWTGNRITCKNWFELTLKEGFTVKRDAEFTKDTHNKDVKIIDDATDLRAAQFPADSGPLSHPTRPENVAEFNNIYTTTVYEKSAAVIDSLHAMLGDDLWRAGTDLYFDRHDGQAVTCMDFVDCIEDASGRDLTLFRRWWEQSGTPEVSYEGVYDEQAKTYTLTLSQKTPPTTDQKEKSALHIPLAAGLLDANGNDMSLHIAGDHDDTQGTGDTTRILELDADTKTIIFKNIDSKPVLSLNRGFTSPVKITTTPSTDELTLRSIHDSDGFNKFDAMNTLWMNEITSLIRDFKADKPLVISKNFIRAFEGVLDNALKTNQGVSSLQLSAPSYKEIAQNFDIVDPEAIHKVTTLFKSELGNHFKETLQDIYDATETPKGEKWELAPEQVGRRSLHNRTLGYMAATKEPALIQKAVAQYEGAETMTARWGALSALVADHADTKTYQKALDSFYKRYQDNVNVMIKWLTIQAETPLADTLETVADLLNHPDVDFWNSKKAPNPNQLRAIAGTLANDNPVSFHRTDGKGYELVTDIIMELAKRGNDQVAARMAGAFQDWRNYSAERQELMQTQMERIATGEIGNGLKDIITRCLAMKPKDLDGGLDGLSNEDQKNQTVFKI